LIYNGQEEEKDKLEYWYNEIKKYAARSKIFILLNEREPKVSEITAKDLKDECHNVDFDSFSIKYDKDKIEEFRTKIVNFIKKNQVKLGFPFKFFRLKKEFEHHFAGNIKYDYIEVDKFNEIAKKQVYHIDNALYNLCYIGTCLWYKELGHLLVLNPEWIIQGVFRIIDWANRQEQNKHSVTQDDFSIVFENDSRYPKDKHIFLYKLMKLHRLAYETMKIGRILIPSLLNNDCPKTLPVFPVDESLMFRFKADRPIPTDIFSHFIARYYEAIKKEGKDFLVWRYGVVTEYENDTIAFARELKDKNEIIISVTGSNKAIYWDELQRILISIFNIHSYCKIELQQIREPCE